jgi:hypothetical protein
MIYRSKQNSISKAMLKNEFCKLRNRIFLRG